MPAQDDFQDSLLDALTDVGVYEMLPGEEIIRRILAAYAVPPEVLEELNKVNYHEIEAQMRHYEEILFGKKRGRERRHET